MNRDFYLKMLDLKIELYDPNPVSPYDIDTNDCTIRAISKLLNKDWNTVFKELSEIAFEEKRMLNTYIVLNKYLSMYNYQYKKFKPSYITIGEFIYKNKDNEFIIGNKTHVTYYNNGVIYDNTDINIDGYILQYCNSLWIHENNKLIYEDFGIK